MTISTRVKSQLFASTPTNREQLIRLPVTSTKQGGVVVARYAPRLTSALSPSVSQKVIKTWTRQEHDLFLQGLERHPHGPWKKIADFIGSKTARQTMAHAQKYRQKIARRQLIWKTAAAALNNSVAAAAAAAHQLHAPVLSAHYVDMYRSNADWSALSSSASSTPETSDDEGWTTDSSGRTRFDSIDVLSPCQQGLACSTDCDNCFFELEILPMLAQMDTTSLKDE